MEKQILTIIGAFATLIGIINGIIELNKKISLKTIIIFLCGVIILLIGIIIKPQCKYPTVKIESPAATFSAESEIEIKGTVKCCPDNYRIAILIHRIKNNNDLEKWFIHPECASVNTKSDWILTGVMLGTPNTKNTEFEIFAYLIPDSVCISIRDIVKDPLYQGNFNKPAEINGVYDKIILKR